MRSSYAMPFSHDLSCMGKSFFPMNDTNSDSEVMAAADRLQQEPKDNLLVYLHLDGGSPADCELLLQQRLEALLEAHRQKLQEMGRLHQEDLERRILHDSLMAVENERAAKVNSVRDELYSPKSQQDVNRNPNRTAPRTEGPRRACSLTDLSSVKAAASEVSVQRQRSPSPFNVSSVRPQGTTVPKPFRMTLREAQRKSQLLHTKVPPDVEKLLENKGRMEEMECQKKFHALPVPDHVVLPLYRNITEAQEQARIARVAQRREMLLSMQKPFSFLLREQKKSEERMCVKAEGEAKGTRSMKVRQPIPKAVMDPGVSERLIEEEVLRKMRIQMRAQDMLRSSTAPIEIRPDRGGLETRCDQRTKKAMLGFLDEKSTFQPRINPQVPDFDRLQRAFLKEAARRPEKDVTRCQPFQLRTSALPQRQNRKNQDTPQTPAGKTALQRSHSFGGITSLSADTLPTYITDAVRQRCSATRRSLEEKQSKEHASVEWMKEHRMKSQALRRTVTMRARAMDPHRSLKEVFQEKLKQHRERDSQRMKEYRKELQEMKSRVKVRPYLFEQVTQKNAKWDAEKRYRDALLQAGLDEQFVRTKGEPSLSSDKEGDSIEDELPIGRDTEEATDGEEEESD